VTAAIANDSSGQTNKTRQAVQTGHGQPAWMRLGGFDDQAGSEAARTNADVFAGSVHLDVNATQIWALDALGLDVRMADVVGHPTLFAADCARSWHKFLRKGG
jgi:hypothetical protein